MNKFVLSPHAQKHCEYIRIRFNVKELSDYVANSIVIPDTLDENEYYYRNKEIIQIERLDDLAFLNKMKELFKDKLPTVKLIEAELAEDDYESIEFRFIIKELIGETNGHVGKKKAPHYVGTIDKDYWGLK